MLRLPTSPDGDDSLATGRGTRSGLASPRPAPLRLHLLACLALRCWVPAPAWVRDHQPDQGRHRFAHDWRVHQGGTLFPLGRGQKASRPRRVRLCGASRDHPRCVDHRVDLCLGPRLSHPMPEQVCVNDGCGPPPDPHGRRTLSKLSRRPRLGASCHVFTWRRAGPVRPAFLSHVSGRGVAVPCAARVAGQVRVERALVHLRVALDPVVPYSGCRPTDGGWRPSPPATLSYTPSCPIAFGG